MNKVELRKELLCLMEVASLPTGPAALEAEIESFFVSGAARIDLIGKCMDLDNEMGGYLFDVPLLSDTENAIKEVGKSDGEKLTYSQLSPRRTPLGLALSVRLREMSVL